MCPEFLEPEDLESSDDDESYIPCLVESEPEWEPDSEDDE